MACCKQNTCFNAGTKWCSGCEHDHPGVDQFDFYQRKRPDDKPESAGTAGDTHSDTGDDTGSQDDAGAAGEPDKPRSLTKPHTLVLFSGGKDSFVTACRLVTSGSPVTLLFLDNGSIICPENVARSAQRLRNRYGGAIQYAGSYPTVSTLWRLNQAWTYKSWSKLGRSYPGMFNAQANCLHCQSAMWIAAMAYAKAKNIHRIAAGYKSCDVFCTGMDQWLQRLRQIGSDHGIRIMTPLWNTPEWLEHAPVPDYGRDLELELHGFQPAVLEPKCMIGRPVETPDTGLINVMMAYFDKELAPLFDDQIEHLAGIFQHIRLSDAAWSVPEYHMPDGSHGLY